MALDDVPKIEKKEIELTVERKLTIMVRKIGKNFQAHVKQLPDLFVEMSCEEDAVSAIRGELGRLGWTVRD